MADGILSAQSRPPDFELRIVKWWVILPAQFKDALDVERCLEKLVSMIMSRKVWPAKYMKIPSDEEGIFVG